MSQRQAAYAASVCLLYGRKGKEDRFDEYLAARHLGAIRSAVFGDGEPMISEFDAREADLADVLDEVSTPALFGASRLVVLTDAQTILAPLVEERERLAPYLDRIRTIASSEKAPGHLVLVASGLKITSQAPTSTFPEAARLIEAVLKRGGAFSCVPPYESGLKAALFEKARESGVRLDKQAADLLIALVGTDQMALMEELDKLITEAVDSRRIDSEDVEKLAAGRPEGNVFALAEKIIDRDTTEALRKLRQLRSTPATRSSAFIIASLAASFRRYFTAALAVERGESPQAAVRHAGVNAYFQREFLSRLSRWDAVSLSALSARMLKCDVDIKTGTTSEESALETFILDATQGNLTRTPLVGAWLHEI